MPSEDATSSEDAASAKASSARGPAPWFVALAIAAAIGWALLITITFRTPFGFYWFSFIGPGWAFIAAGLVAWTRRPENRTGRLMTLTGFLLLFPTLSASRIPILHTIGSLFLDAGAPALFYLVLSYPRGSLFTRPSRVLFGTALVFALGLDIGSLPWADPRDFGCIDCPEGLNLLLIERNPEVVLTWFRVIAFVTIPAMLALAATVTTRWLRATGPARTILWPVYLPTVLFSLFQVYLIVDLNFLRGAFPGFNRVLPYVQPVILTLLPLTFLLGLLRLRARRTRVGDLVVEARRPAPGRLQQAVARALGDPAAEIGIYESGRYRDTEGNSMDLPGEGSDRVATFLERDGEPLAVIVHDRALLEDPKLLNSVRAATALAVENELLAAEVRAQLEDVRASRARIVAAADQERRRVERDIHDGVQQHLVAIGAKLRAAQDLMARDPGQATEMMEEIAAQTGETLESLRDLARGIYPPLLSDRGVVHALRAHIRKSTSPTKLQSSMADDIRFDPKVEAAVYFCVLEALQNAAKHAPDALAEVHLGLEGDQLVFEVTDQGPGFDPDVRTEGTGLQNMADRLAALGGTHEVRSRPGHGTAFSGRLPVRIAAPS
jgi:signal transduction histidine kinase